MDVHFLEPVLEHDMTVSLLGEVAYYDDGNSKHCIRTALKGRFVRFMGTLPPNVTVVLIVGAKVHMTGNQATLFAMDTTQTIPRPYISLSDVKRVVEVCSGAGFLGVGLDHCGFEVLLRCDNSPAMLKLA